MKLVNKTALGIDITNDQINLALLTHNKKGIQLLKSASCPIPQGAINNGNIENPVILAKAIKQLKAKNKIYATYTSMSLISNPTLIQLLDIPQTASNNVGQFIRDEVKHYAILPIKNIATDFCGVKSLTKIAQQRALIAATDNQKIIEVGKALNKEGLKIDSLEPASLAYTRACYSKKISKKFDKNLLFAIADENVLTLSLFRNQTLDFIEAKQIEFDRAKPDNYYLFLANQIYAVIHFYELEILNKQNKWEVTVLINKNDESAKEKFDSFANNFNAAEINVLLPGQTYCDTPVENTEITPKPSAVAVGLAMKFCDFSKYNLNINLLPSEIAKVESVQKQSLIIINIAAIILFLMILSIEFITLKTQKINENITQHRQTKLQQDTRTLLNQQESLDRQTKNISKKLENFDNVLNVENFLKWDKVLSDIAIAIPGKVQITNLLTNEKLKMLIKGRSLSYEAVHLFIDNLNNNKNIESASLIETEKNNGAISFVNYSINCSLIP